MTLDAVDHFRESRELCSRDGESNRSCNSDFLILYSGLICWYITRREDHIRATCVHENGMKDTSRPQSLLLRICPDRTCFRSFFAFTVR